MDYNVGPEFSVVTMLPAFLCISGCEEVSHRTDSSRIAVCWRNVQGLHHGVWRDRALAWRNLVESAHENRAIVEANA